MKGTTLAEVSKIATQMWLVAWTIDLDTHRYNTHSLYNCHKQASRKIREYCGEPLSLLQCGSQENYEDSCFEGRITKMSIFG